MFVQNRSFGAIMVRYLAIAVLILINNSNVWCLELIRGEANKDKKRLLFYTNFGIDIGKSKT